MEGRSGGMRARAREREGGREGEGERGRERERERGRGERREEEGCSRSGRAAWPPCARAAVTVGPALRVPPHRPSDPAERSVPNLIQAPPT